jgi:hypothetical protein
VGFRVARLFSVQQTKTSKKTNQMAEKQTKFLMKRNQKQTILSPMNKTLKQVIFLILPHKCGLKTTRCLLFNDQKSC